MKGLYVVEQTYERDLGFFSESPFYAKEPDTPPPDGSKGNGQGSEKSFEVTG